MIRAEILDSRVGPLGGSLSLVPIEPTMGFRAPITFYSADMVEGEFEVGDAVEVEVKKT
jgi:hypothetical protein